MNARMSLSLTIEPDEQAHAGHKRPAQSDRERPPMPAVSTDRSERFDAAVTEMRAFLDRFNPESDAEALQSLRKAFPAAPLSDRIAAIRNRFFL